MDGDEGLDVPVVFHKVHDGLDLHFGIGKLATVSFRAGVAAGSRLCGRGELAFLTPKQCSFRGFWSLRELRCRRAHPHPG